MANPFGIGRAAPGTRKKRRKAAASTLAPTRRKKRTSTKRPARLVKGSAAAKRYMASIRKRRK
jgi:hypothetical protein